MTAEVVVLGWGAIASGGVGESAFTPAPVSGFGARVVEEFDVAAHVRMRGLRPLGRASRLACVAAASALDHPRPLAVDGSRCAVVVGSRWGHIDPLFDFEHSAAVDGPSLVNPSQFPNVVANVHAGYLGILFGLAGPNATLCGSGAGLEAIGYALDLIDLGRAETVLAGGVEALGPALLEAGRRNANGAAPGEGAAFLLLGRADGGPTPLAEVAALATAPSWPAALESALEEAEVEPDELAGAFVVSPQPLALRVPEPILSITELAGECQAASGALAAAAAAAAVVRTRRPAVAASLGDTGTQCAIVLRPPQSTPAAGDASAAGFARVGLPSALS